ncbi:MAG: hypothetical protein V1933_01570 [Candidatus Omnitrophota bacterium]
MKKHRLDMIFSGFIGSVIGVIATIGLYWHSRYISTKRAIVDRLSILQHDVYWNYSESDVFKTWDASLKEIWVLYNAFMDFAPPIKKGKACRAWKNYKGEDQKTIKELANEGWIVDNKKPPKNKNEFLYKIYSFIKAL